MVEPETDEIKGLKSYLNNQIEAYHRKFDELSHERSNFEVERAHFYESMAKITEEYEIRKTKLDARERELEIRMGQLVWREGWIADAEADIRDFAFKLSRADRP